MSLKSRMLAGLVGGIALILCILAVELILSGEKTIQKTIGTASISFTANHQMVIAPGGCVTVMWHVEYIQAVFINGTPTVGDGMKDICVDETHMPVLRVKLDDNSQADYPLQIDFLIDQPSTWLLVSAIVLLALTALYVVVSSPAAVTAEGRARRTSRLTALFAGIGLVVTGLLITGIVLELLVRFYFGTFGTDTEKVDYLYTRSEINAGYPASVVPLPFVGVGLSPDYPGQNSLGYRGDEIQIPKPDGDYRIVAMGDSSTYGVFLPHDQTYPYDLEQILHDDGYKNVEVINGGVPGYSSWNILVDLALRVSMLQPDLVIFYEGANDEIPREVAPDCYSALSPFWGLYPPQGAPAPSKELSPSALYRFIAINLGWMEELTPSTADSAPDVAACDTPSSANVAQNVAANSPTYFERNEREMVALEKGNHAQTLLVSWTYDHTSEFAYPYWSAAVDTQNAVSKQVAEETGALYFDYAAVAPNTDRSYWDDYTHMNAKGELQLAQSIADFLVEQHVIAGGG